MIALVSAGVRATGPDAVIFTVHAIDVDGLVCRSNGPGRMWFPTHSPGGFTDWLLPRNPNKSN